jgi:MFS family permease
MCVMPAPAFRETIYFHQYAAVMGMNEDLKLVGNNFTDAATALYIATLIAELATGKLSLTPQLSHASPQLCIQRLHPSKIPARRVAWVNVILWGMATASTAVVTNYHGLLICRIFLGIFEAAMSPCLMLITGVTP